MIVTSERNTGWMSAQTGAWSKISVEKGILTAPIPISVTIRDHGGWKNLVGLGFRRCTITCRFEPKFKSHDTTEPSIP